MPLISFFTRFQRPVSIAPLVIFRVLFGLMMLAGTLRFWLNGWITDLYVKPKFYFTYWGFEWVRPLGDTGMHLLFLCVGVSALLIATGLFYRIAAVLFFLSFTYIELIDVTNYLNHYYFISLTALLMIFLPANRYFSVDVKLWPSIKKAYVPLWAIGAIRLQIGIIYFFAGLAKLNADWLLNAMPMKLWLPAKSHLPVIGNLMYQSWVAYFFSWFGAVYDLLIAFFLTNYRTRPVAYVFVLGFHLATALFFPGIGMFPYVMIICSFAFFSSALQQRLLNRIGNTSFLPASTFNSYHVPVRLKSVLTGAAIVYFTLQVVVPLRFLLYPGNLFWYEEGYRFSWRVMLMEKSGNTFFYVKEPSTKKAYEVNNAEFLTPLQEKMMSTQPDMMLRYAHYLAGVYAQRGIKKPAVYAECYVALNGRRSTLFTDTTIDLSRQPLSWQHYNWILPYVKK
ncbi:HTTM domain-containing protein [Mucilaginibacter sp. UR6-1]|uniref:HTTM domain-containing protein n=1 Tax=Mucilaginibacter sp. UR6-1 TaxID=1435643 RepID=UPI001E521889|nr:HTTM domain-containing protein [Mucilaginibacter sp. UR6-1]MCC8411197.1 HTTM domain-containing protein [Mucilaginibacter sp. UR6-1]